MNENDLKSAQLAATLAIAALIYCRRAGNGDHTNQAAEDSFDAAEIFVRSAERRGYSFEAIQQAAGASL